MTAAPPPAAPRRRVRNIVVTTAKLALTVAIVGWLIATNKLDLDRLRQPLAEPGLVVAALLLAAFNVSTSAVRWVLLLRSEGIDCSLRLALRLTWIGHFWNVVIPGAVSGDAVKMYYIGRCVPERREEAWTTVFADRLIGMAALVTVSTVAAAANFDFMWSRPQLRNTAGMMVAVLVALAGGGALLALGVGRGTQLADSFRKRLPLVDTLRRAYHALLRLGRRPLVVAIAFVISFFSHASAVLTMLIIGHTVHEQTLGFVQYCVVVPVALFANALPLTPGGIGVGEAVLGNLFAWSGGSAQDGTTIMLLYRIFFYILALFGAVLYILHRSEVLGPDEAPDAPAGRSGADTTSAIRSP
jgi:uncharacterized protein (TIRG00374 family)